MRYGDGTIYKRHSDGLYCAALRSRENGKRQSFYGRSKNEVRDKLNVYKELQARHVSYSQASQSIAVFAKEWLLMQRSRLRPHVLIGYTRYIALLTNYYGKVPLMQLDALHLQKLYRAEEQRVSASHVIHLHRVIHKMLADAVHMRTLSYNIAENVLLPRIAHTERIPLTLEQVQSFLSSAEAHSPYYVLFLLALATGMREGELLGLHWNDIDTEAHTITIRKTLRHISGMGAVELPPKTESSARVVVYPAYVAESLARYKQQQLAWRLQAGKTWQQSQYIFTNTTGAVLRTEYLRNAHFYPLLEKAHLPRIHFHDLRHSAISHLLAAGVQPKVVQKMMGHKSLNVTMSVYAHVFQEQEMTALQSLEVYKRAI